MLIHFTFFSDSITDFDVVMFHIRDMKEENEPVIKLPETRSPNQRYVMFLMESPSYDLFPYEEFQNYFNWTMTYKRNSDFFRPYGWIAPNDWKWHYPSSTLPSLNFSQYPIMSSELKNVSLINEKKKPVAWLVSNCRTHSQREHYVETLSKHIQVDVYGHCHNNSRCPEKADDKCSEYIQNNYMFYLSFENSVCDEYVTEKFWSYLQGKLVPIVLGGADYDKIAPPHSFINAMDYPDPKDLAKHLNYLISNQTAYNEYLWWKPYYTVFKDTPENFARAMCQMCEVLNDPNPKQTPSIYENIQNWWIGQGNCQETLPWSKPVYKYDWFVLDDWKDFVHDSTGKGFHYFFDTLRKANVIV